MKYKTILMDSGGVLNKPVTGHWMISPNFFNYVDKSKFYSISKRRRKHAFNKAMVYIKSISIMENTDIEFNHFCEYYHLFSEQLPELKLSEEMIKKLAKDLVYNLDKYEFYKDALDIVPKLKDKYVLSVVSDAWPSLNDVFKYNDFYKYFDAFINSSQIGVTKPHKKMYNSALRATNHKPEEAIFIDDRIKNCSGAKAIGINRTYLLCRNKLAYIYYKLTVEDHIVVKNLYMVYENLQKNK